MTETDINAILAERGANYGSFDTQARITQNIKASFRGGNMTNWFGMADDQREALEMIANKIGRLINGDPNHIDGWRDIEGYSKLVADRLEREQKNV